MQGMFLSWLLLSPLALVQAVLAADDAQRPAIWIDLYRGEPVSREAMLKDLAGARVVYLGERHRLERHHATQTKILVDLARRGVPMVLGLEQMESVYQPVLDRYNRGEIDFDRLAELTNWPEHWPGYQQYRPLVEAAHEAGAMVLALNARGETIRQIARGGGIERLPPSQRKELPAEIRTDDPLYEKLLNLYLNVHATATPDRLRPMVEAQIARDETMAANLTAFLRSKAGRGRTAVVICGAGHVAYGLGMPERVRRRLGNTRDRIVLLSESGDVRLKPEEQAMAREINVTHEQLRAIGRPAGDYLHAVGLSRQQPEEVAPKEGAGQ